MTYSSSSHRHSDGHSNRDVNSLLKPLPSLVRCERGGFEGPHTLFTHVTTFFYSIAASSLLAPSDPFCNLPVSSFSQYITNNNMRHSHFDRKSQFCQHLQNQEWFWVMGLLGLVNRRACEVVNVSRQYCWKTATWGFPRLQLVRFYSSSVPTII